MASAGGYAGILFFSTSAPDVPGSDFYTAYEWLQQPILSSSLICPNDSVSPLDFFCDHPPSFIRSWDTIGTEVAAFLETCVPRQGQVYAEGCQWEDSRHMHRVGTRRGLAFVLEQRIGGCMPGGMGPKLGVTGTPDVSVGQLGGTGTPDVTVGHGARCLVLGEVEHPLLLGSISVGEMAAAFAAGGNASHPAVPVFNRLHEHMILSSTNYGFVTTGDYTWFCANVPGGMAISEPVARDKVTFSYLFYLLYAGLQVQQPLQHGVGVVSQLGRPLPALGKDVQAEIREQVKGLVRKGIAGMTSKSVEKRLKFWTIGTDFILGTRPFPFQHACTIVHATYRGMNVVLKIRDMSDVNKGFNVSLASFLRETLVYKRLKRLQGVCVPKLLDFGFASGYMLGVLVLSDGGKYMKHHPGTPNVAAAVIQRLHAAGVYHGYIHSTDLLVSSLQPLAMTVVGFSDAGLRENATADTLEQEVIRARCVCGEPGWE